MSPAETFRTMPIISAMSNTTKMTSQLPCCCSSGSGVCVLDRTGLRYTGTKDGETVDVMFPLHQVYRLLFGAGVNFETYTGTQIWYFVPEVKQSCVEWYMASMILYDETQAGE